MKTDVMGRQAIKTTNGIVNIVVLTVIIVLVTFAGYALWDSNQIYQAADKSQYEVYKPTIADEGRSFKELQSLNSEVIAWLSVYGTNIDYPVTQSKDNMKYVNTNAEGLYSLSGSIFLDYHNSPDFSDFNSILFGHHMEKQKMFGEIESFSDRDMFDTHRYGNLYYEDKDHGIMFFAFVHCDAYDKSVFTPNVMGGEARQTYLDGLLETAILKNDIGITITDRIILLSTCSSDSTNGRDVLIGRITDEVYEDPFIIAEANEDRQMPGVDSPARFSENISGWLPWLIMIIALILIPVLIVYLKKLRSG